MAGMIAAGVFPTQRLETLSQMGLAIGSRAFGTGNRRVLVMLSP
jgi:hypothetical protein